MRNTSTSNVKPFLRWAGGKQWLAHKLIRLIPKHSHTYYEPFLGGGALFFAAGPENAVLGDINDRLIAAYQVLCDRPKALIRVLSQWPNDGETYYEVRKEEYEDEIWRAAQFLYLNKTCWNGLYRVNQHGQFNVPFGSNKREVFDRAHLLRASQTLHNANAKLVCCDFQELVKTASAGDFVYLDPPYTVLHSRNGFRRYNERLFSWKDQIRLAQVAHELADRGCLVVVSNADNEEVRKLYSDFLYQSISRHSTLAADAGRRREIQEAIFVSANNFCRMKSNVERIKSR